LSDAVAVMQSIAGVLFVDVDRFGAVRQSKDVNLTEQLRQLARNARVHVDFARLRDGLVAPAQVCYLTPDVPDTLILEQIR
jgi:hypothetical protein